MSHQVMHARFWVTRQLWEGRGRDVYVDARSGMRAICVGALPSQNIVNMVRVDLPPASEYEEAVDISFDDLAAHWTVETADVATSPLRA